MEFIFDKPSCQNLRKAIRKEWLLTNGRGDYASGTVPGCNTRKYHGMLVANIPSPAGRYVLLSTLEESILGAEKEFFFSCRKHPGLYYPRGHELLEYVEVNDNPLFRYRIGNVTFTRELLLLHNRAAVIIRYNISTEDEIPPLSLCIKPQLAYRHFHQLTRANEYLQTSVTLTENGFQITPYPNLPTLHMAASTPQANFTPEANWCRNVDYIVEEERGFPAQEDLFIPGSFHIPLTPNVPVYLAAATDPLDNHLEALWFKEKFAHTSLLPKNGGLMAHLRREGTHFLVSMPCLDSDGQHDAPQTADSTKIAQIEEIPAVIAGYQWFDTWGRDTLIALPGLTFAASRPHRGEVTLRAVSEAVKDGLVPNLFRMGDQKAAYNSVDASLWYVWAVQQMEFWLPEKEELLRDICWPTIKSIIAAFKKGIQHNGEPIMFVDEELLLHAGNEQTQLTWMDAQANGRPVTPRHGCPVEINALWYNALAYANDLAHRYGEAHLYDPQALKQLRQTFFKYFWVPTQGGYLGDVWRDGMLDASIRPNQIFAVSLPYTILDMEEHPCVVECVRNNLLTPYGLRTLSPGSPAYCGHYEGAPDARDAAYHQGTVWPWLLGAYGEALLKTAWDTEGAVHSLLDTLTPLFTTHITDAGLRSISEIFDGNMPHLPNGCIAQAWSVAECHRLLRLLEHAAPETYASWEAKTEWR